MHAYDKYSNMDLNTGMVMFSRIQILSLLRSKEPGKLQIHFYDIWFKWQTWAHVMFINNRWYVLWRGAISYNFLSFCTGCHALHLTKSIAFVCTIDQNCYHELLLLLRLTGRDYGIWVICFYSFKLTWLFTPNIMSLRVRLISVANRGPKYTGIHDYPGSKTLGTTSITSTQVMVYHWWIPCETLVHTGSR